MIFCQVLKRQYLKSMSKQSEINPREHVNLIYVLLNTYFRFLQKERSELVNQCYILLDKASKRFKREKGFKFSSYAMWYMRVGLINYLKRENKRVHQEFIENSHTKIPINNHPSRIDVQRIIQTLPKNERKLMIEYFYKGHTLEYIGKQNHTTAQTISNHKNRILKKLKANLHDTHPMNYF